MPEAINRMNVTDFEYNLNEVGKLYKSSKLRFTWKLKIDKTPHEICLTVSKISGKYKLTVDGVDAMNTGIDVKMRINFEFEIGKYKAELVRSNQDFYRFELYIDDVRIEGPTRTSCLSASSGEGSVLASPHASASPIPHASARPCAFMNQQKKRVFFPQHEERDRSGLDLAPKLPAMSPAHFPSAPSDESQVRRIIQKTLKNCETTSTDEMSLSDVSFPKALPVESQVTPHKKGDLSSIFVNDSQSPKYPQQAIMSLLNSNNQESGNIFEAANGGKKPSPKVEAHNAVWEGSSDVEKTFPYLSIGKNLNTEVYASTNPRKV